MICIRRLRAAPSCHIPPVPTPTHVPPESPFLLPTPVSSTQNSDTPHSPAILSNDNASYDIVAPFNLTVSSFSLDPNRYAGSSPGGLSDFEDRSGRFSVVMVDSLRSLWIGRDDSDLTLGAGEPLADDTATAGVQYSSVIN